MITLYRKDETSFTDNGICILDPVVCEVNETAGGEYELHLEHPMDDLGKYLLLAEDMLIKAPVPPTFIPKITLPEVRVWKTNQQTPLYSKLPLYKKSIDSVSRSDYASAVGDISKYMYNSAKTYNSGALAVVYVYPGRYLLYKAKKANYGIAPGSDFSVWAYAGDLGTSSSGGNPNPTYTPGTVAETLENNTTLQVISDVNSAYIKVKAPSGTEGFVARDACQEQAITAGGEEIPARTITEQVFRIYELHADDETQTVTVEARHKSYDFAGNALFTCKVAGAEPLDAIANIQSSLMIEDSRRIACNITGKQLTNDWSYKNPVNALLDPDTGIVPQLKAKLIRDNDDFFILDNSTPIPGITIEYGVNMLGVNWSRSSENVITRILPRCKSGNTDYLYLDDLFVDSPNAGLYPFHKIEVLNCNYQVDKEFTKPDGTKVMMTEESCKTQMLADAQARFSKDHVDSIQVTLDVEFVLLGDTEEYKQYKGLESVSLYDLITVKTGKSGITATAQVSGYTYDSILKRYRSITIGEISSFNRRVAGYRLTKESIGIEKLAPDLVDQIVSSGDSASSNSGGSDGGSGGSGTGTVTEVVDNLTSTSTTAALSANQGRVLALNTQRKRINASASATITLPGNGAGLLLIKRGSTIALVGFDYWTANYEVLAGEVDSNVTITKAASSYEITIANGRSSAIEILAI